MRKTTTEITIAIILLICVITSIIFNPRFGVPFIFGIIGMVSVFVSLLLRKKSLALGILIFVLLLSTFNLVKFTEAFGCSFGFLSLVPLFLLIALFISRKDEIIGLAEGWLGEDGIEISKSQEDRIAFYKREFENLSSEELVRRGNNEKLVEEARIAIDRLLKERDMTMKSL